MSNTPITINLTNTPITVNQLIMDNCCCPYSLANWSEELNCKNDYDAVNDDLDIESFAETFGLSELAGEEDGGALSPAPTIPPSSPSKLNNRLGGVTFCTNESLNNRIALYYEPLAKESTLNLFHLQVDALVHATNEHFERWANPSISNHLYNKAGKPLLQCLYNKLKSCQIGHVKITKGYSIKPSYIIHTASPHYKYKYHTACEQALFNCYLHTLQAARHYNLRTLAMPNLALANHNYPEPDGVHLAVRVLRCFMEHFPEAFDLVVLYVQTPRQYQLYRQMLRLYFPRDQHEQAMFQQRFRLPTIGPLGEPICPERAIRIQPNPVKHFFNNDAINDSGLDDNSYEDNNSIHDYSHSWSYSEHPGHQSPTTNTSTLNIDECRERLMQLHFNGDDHDYEDDDSSLSSSPLTNVGSPVSRSYSSSFRTIMEQRFHVRRNRNLTDNHEHERKRTNTVSGMDDDSLDHLIYEQHRRQLKFERLLRKTRRLEKQTSNENTPIITEQIKQRLQRCCYVVSTTTSDLHQPQSILIIIGYELMKLYQHDLQSQHFDYILAHFLKQLDKCCCHSGTENNESCNQQYSIVYFHSMIESFNSESLNDNINGQESNQSIQTTKQMLNRLNEYLSDKHRRMLRQLYLIQPSIMNRMYVWWLKTFHCQYLKNKVTFVSNVHSLSTIFGESFFDEQHLPEWILGYEQTHSLNQQ